MRRLALFTFAVWSPLSASAENIVIRSETSYFVQTITAGTSCGVEFVIVFQDAIWRKGGLAAITGSLTWLENANGVSLILKIGGMDFESSSLSRPAPFRLSSAFLSAKNEKPRITGTQCEDHRTLCGSFNMPVSLSALDALNEGNLSIGFNRETNGPDVLLPFDASITKTSDKQAFAAFQLCAATLSKHARPQSP